MTVVTLGSGRADTGGGGASRADRVGACLERARSGETVRARRYRARAEPAAVACGAGRGPDPTQEAADVVQTTGPEPPRPPGPDPVSVAVTSAGPPRPAGRHGGAPLSGPAARYRTARRSLGPVADPDPPRATTALRRTAPGPRRHFNGLPERCRALLGIVAQVARPDYATVAEAMGMPVGSIGPTRGRCLAKLREMLLADPRWSA